MSPALRILGHARSINVRKVLWTADELGLAYQHEDMGGPTGPPLDTPAFKRLNPNALVPVLIATPGAGAPGGDQPLVLWESNSICRYLAGIAEPARAERLLPRAPGARAQVERWMDWQLGELNPAWRPAFLHGVRGQAVPADALAHCVLRWSALMQVLEAQLARTGAYVAGPAFTLADIVLGLSANRWAHTPFDALFGAKPDLPRVQAWMARLQARPAGERWAFNGVA